VFVFSLLSPIAEPHESGETTRLNSKSIAPPIESMLDGRKMATFKQFRPNSFLTACCLCWNL